MNQTLYCTLAEAKNEMSASATVDDSTLLRRIQQVSRRIDREFSANRPLFAPYRELRPFELNGMSIDSFRRIFQFRDPLLALEAVSINSTALTLNTQVRTLPNAYPPFYDVQLTQSTDSWYLWCNTVNNGDWLRYVNITGVWGWHAQYSAAWLAVDTLQAGINASVTSLTVADVDGSNEYGYAPRISAGNLLQIDTEWMHVTATNTTTNAVTVVRGVNGSTAAAHSNGASVSVWQVDENIKRATTRQVGNNYAKRGAYDTSTVTDLATVTFTADFLAEVREIMQSMAYI